MMIPLRLIATVALPALIDGARVVAHLRAAEPEAAEPEPTKPETAEPTPAPAAEGPGVGEQAHAFVTIVVTHVQKGATWMRTAARWAWDRHLDVWRTNPQYREAMTSFIPNLIPDRWPGQQQAVRIILRYWFPPASATT